MGLHQNWIHALAIANVQIAFTDNSLRKITRSFHRYFYHEEKGLSSWEHPSDDFFRVLYQRCKAVESQLSASGYGVSGSTLVHQELSGQIEVLKKKYAELKESADRVLLENEEFARRAAVSQQVNSHNHIQQMLN